jgi:hypothetical protein
VIRTLLVECNPDDSTEVRDVQVDIPLLPRRLGERVRRGVRIDQLGSLYRPRVRQYYPTALRFERRARR